MHPNPFRESLRVLGVYIRAQFLIVGVVTVLYLIGFTLVGVPLWLLTAIMAGLLQFIPKFGALLALFLVEAICAIDDSAGYWRMALVFVIWVLVQAIDGFVITPRILGRPLGLKPLLVFAAILAGSFLFGPLGLFLAVPALAIAAVFFRYFQNRYEHGSRQRRS